MKPVVIYIIGAGNSGTTLLSMVLGAHPQMVSVGELSQLDRYCAFDSLCTCGEPVSRCSFWTRINDDSKSRFPLNPTSSLSQLLLHRGSILRHDPHCASVFSRNTELYEKISEVSGRPVIVDASKSPLRLYYLFRSGQIQLIPVYIARDGRAYMDSAKRRGGHAISAYFRWIRHNLVALTVLKRMRPGERMLHINYSEFTQAPALYLKEICKQAGLDYDAAMLNYHEQTFHNISGMRTRFALEPIKPNEAWQERLSVFSRALFALLGGHYFNRRFRSKYKS